MNNDASITTVTVVIRSVGERTETVCRDLVAQQIPQKNIVIVSNAPFSATLADSYRVGIERGLKWTLCVDADVLVVPNAISGLLDAAHKLSTEACEVQGLVLDKFFGVRRPAGNHLYRTSLLSKALSLIPPDEKAIRPEYYTLNRMAERGHPWVETPLVVGLHDFEQYSRDIFRKCYVHARKHATEMHLLVDYWRRMARQDNDYRVALGGLAAGIADAGEAQVDVRRDYGFSKCATAENWKEKRALEASQITLGEIERTLAKWESPGEGLEQFGASCAKEIVHDGRSVPQTQRIRRDLGLLRILPWAAGRVLGKVGRHLERLSSR